MSRELDAEIARLDGCTVEFDPEGTPLCGCRPSVHHAYRDTFSDAPVIAYSEDLNALMALIRRRWPEATVELNKGGFGYETVIYANIQDAALGKHPALGSATEGADDAERLAHAVRDALQEELVKAKGDGYFEQVYPKDMAPKGNNLFDSGAGGDND